MSAKEVAEKLAGLLEDSEDDGLVSLRTLEEADIASDDPGFVIRYDDGSKYEIIVIES